MFDDLLSISEKTENVKLDAGGKPSTWFPPERLVEHIVRPSTEFKPEKQEAPEFSIRGAGKCRKSTRGAS